MQTAESKSAEFRTDSDDRAPNPHLILFALWLMMFSASSQVMAPILPRIGHELNIPEVFQGTLVSSYAIVAGICALVMGPVSEKIGRRRVLVLGTGANGWVMTGVAAGQVMGIPIGTVLADWYGFYAPFDFLPVPCQFLSS